MWLLFESGYHLRAAFIKLGMEDEEIHCLKEGGVAGDTRSQSEEALPGLPLQGIPSSRPNQTLHRC